MSIERPRIALLATGGTIVSSGKSPDQMTGYGIENFRVTNLVAAVPGIEKIAELEVEQVANIDSSSMTYGVWRALAERIEAYAAREDIDGIVVTHGTDTLEETAYFLTLVLNTAKPVVLTGAMRPATALSADGPLNLYNAVRVASTPAAHKKGVLIVLNDLILDAREGTKTNPTNVATFFSRDFGAIGMIAGPRIEFFRCPSRAHTIRTPFSVENLPDELPRVDIVVSHADDDGVLVRAAVAAGACGIIHAGTGNGSVHGNTEEALMEASKAGVIVVRASRVGGGMTVEGLAHWQEAGWIPSGSLLPWKARVLLQLALTRTDSPAAVKEMFSLY